MIMFTMNALRFKLLLLVLPLTASGFNINPCRQATLAIAATKDVKLFAASSGDILTESGFEKKMPSNPDAERIGIREWPKQIKMGSWDERFDTGQVGARYILEGAGMVVVTLYENDGYTPKVTTSEEYRVIPGNLVEVMGPCKLEWRTDEDAEMVILTPGYEQGSLLAAVGALFVVLCGALIAGVGH
jgi:hypothetical protein